VKKLFPLLIFLIIPGNGNAQSNIVESYRLVNDINKAENRKAIYMCADVNYTWIDYLKNDPKADKRQQLQDLKHEAIIKAYIGGDKTLWLKNLPKIKTWKGNVTAKEFVPRDITDADYFSQTHNNTGFYLYSEPLFNESGDKAIVYIWYVWSGLGIDAHYYYCEKKDGVWKKVNSIWELGGFVS
jgi:hypothetical protein